MHVCRLVSIVLVGLSLQAVGPLPSSATEPPGLAVLDLLSPAGPAEAESPAWFQDWLGGSPLPSGAPSSVAPSVGLLEVHPVEPAVVEGSASAGELVVSREGDDTWRTPLPLSAGEQREFVADSSVTEVATCPEGFVAIQAGTFIMGSQRVEWGRGSDEDLHRVTLSRGFCMQVTEVTQASWSRVMGTSPSSFAACGEDCPVERVNWYDALAYANALSRSVELEECYSLSSCRGVPGSGTVTGEGAPYYGAGDYVCDSVGFVGVDCTGYRLPTESEWEYAARAGTSGARYGAIDDVAWYDGNSGGRMRRVGAKQANAWGLYDMLGNVWEWVWDGSGAYPISDERDPLGDESSDLRVFRGGSWGIQEQGVRAANRYGTRPTDRDGSLGFRLVRSLPTLPAAAVVLTADDVATNTSLIGTWDADMPATRADMQAFLADLPESERQAFMALFDSGQTQLTFSADGTMNVSATMMGEEWSAGGTFSVVSTEANVVTLVVNWEINGVTTTETMITTFLDADTIVPRSERDPQAFIFRRRISTSDPR